MSSVDDVDQLLRAGADKVAVNTAAIRRPELVAEIADRFGNQVLVLSVDARRAAGHRLRLRGDHPRRPQVGRPRRHRLGRAARAELGAGEILLNAMDADGTQAGFDLELIRAVRREVTFPVIASGGAGRLEHFAPAVDAGADAVLAATVFHFGTLRIGEVKSGPGRGGAPRPMSEYARSQPGQLGRAAPAHAASPGYHFDDFRATRRTCPRWCASTFLFSATSPASAGCTSSATSAPTRSRWPGSGLG